MACGRPVVVSQGAAIHEVLTDGRDALLFPPRAPEALADRIERLARDPQLRVTLGDAGVQAIRTTYNWDGFARRVAEVFARVQNVTPRDQRPCSELLAPS
jgi:glycosyltransferase involved in cell wall biosynthesis